MSSIHVEEMSHFVDVQSDNVDTGFDFFNTHVKQSLSVLIVALTMVLSFMRFGSVHISPWPLLGNA